MRLSPGPTSDRLNFRHGDPVRAGQLVTLGDRLFRAGNLKKAEERYQQATRTAPDLAAPRICLAQVALARGNYTEAANRLREAETAEPGWIITAPDIQSIYGEPAEFSRSLAAWSRISRSTPTTAMRGWSWAPSGF